LRAALRTFCHSLLSLDLVRQSGIARADVDCEVQEGVYIKANQSADVRARQPRAAPRRQHTPDGAGELHGTFPVLSPQTRLHCPVHRDERNSVYDRRLYTGPCTRPDPYTLVLELPRVLAPDLSTNGVHRQV
jgi:hypothetical protein